MSPPESIPKIQNAQSQPEEIMWMHRFYTSTGLVGAEEKKILKVMNINDQNCGLTRNLGHTQGTKMDFSYSGLVNTH